MSVPSVGVFFLTGLSLLAQTVGTPEPNQSSQALAVTPQPSSSGESFTLDVRNVSGKNIRGYVLSIQYKNASTGENVLHRSQAVFKPTKNGQRQYISPGQVMNSRKALTVPRDSAGHLAEYTVTVDSVVFEDGSWEGPRELRDSAVLEGMIQEQDRQDRAASFSK